MNFLRPLNQKGFGHIELVLALLFVGLFAFVGIRVMGVNHAGPLLTQKQCTLVGRTWNTTAGSCNKTCASGQGSYVVTSTYDYCSAAITPAHSISAADCALYGRVQLVSTTYYIGCARHAPQVAGASYANAIQCATAGQTYRVLSTYDRCGSTTTASLSGKCQIISPSTITAGVKTASTIVRFTNTGTNSFTIAYDTAGSISSPSGGGRGAGYSGSYVTSGSIIGGAYKDVTVASGSIFNITDKGSTATTMIKNKTPQFECTRSWLIK